MSPQQMKEGRSQCLCPQCPVPHYDNITTQIDLTVVHQVAPSPVHHHRTCFTSYIECKEKMREVTDECRYPIMK